MTSSNCLSWAVSRGWRRWASQTDWNATLYNWGTSIDAVAGRGVNMAGVISSDARSGFKETRIEWTFLCRAADSFCWRVFLSISLVTLALTQHSGENSIASRRICWYNRHKILCVRHHLDDCSAETCRQIACTCDWQIWSVLRPCVLLQSRFWSTGEKDWLRAATINIVKRQLPGESGSSCLWDWWGCWQNRHTARWARQQFALEDYPEGRHSQPSTCRASEAAWIFVPTTMPPLSWWLHPFSTSIKRKSQVHWQATKGKESRSNFQSTRVSASRQLWYLASHLKLLSVVRLVKRAWCRASRAFSVEESKVSSAINSFWSR